MNNFSAKHFLKFLFLAVLIPLLFSCSGVEEDSQLDQAAPTQVEPTVAPTETPLPTKTPKPTAVPTPTPSIEEIYQDIPECKGNQSTDQAVFHELLDNLLSDIEELDELSYTTLYRYLEDNQYPEDELSIFIEAHHDKLIEDLGGGKLFFYPMTSHLYENSSIKLTNLRTNNKSEFIITEDGFWIKKSPADPWIFFEGFASGELMNAAELLSPAWINLLFGGGSGLTPGIWTVEPEMVVEEQINGEEVLHRCWLPGELSGDIDGYLIHYESIYTFLQDTAVHLWTAENDSRLRRLVLTAEHKGERLGEEEFAEHDLVREFLFWLDVNPDSQVDKIQVPEQEDPITFSLHEQEPNNKTEAPHNEFPLPPGAVSADFGIFASASNSPIIPREYLWSHYESTQSALEQFAGPGWYDIPADRIKIFKVDQHINEVLEFYFNSMTNLGWSTEDFLYQPGWSRMYIHFKRGPVSQTTILEEHDDGSMIITGILPPEEKVLNNILQGWEIFDTENSGLQKNSVNSISFDLEGQVWAGSKTTGGWTSLSADGSIREDPEDAGGINIFDGKEWKKFSNFEPGMIGENIYAVNFDSDGTAWISSSDGLLSFDGESWINHSLNREELNAIQEIIFTNDGKTWVRSQNYIAEYSKNRWKTYNHPYSFESFDIDSDGRVWVGTNGGGIFSLENGTWIEQLTPQCESNNFACHDIEDLAFDSDDNLWFIDGTSGLGLYDGETWTYFDPQGTGLGIDYVDELIVDEQNRVWLATMIGGIFMLNSDREWFDFTPDPIGISIYYPQTMEIDQEGRLWIGARNGVAVFTPPDN